MGVDNNIDDRYAIIDVSNLAFARWFTIPHRYWIDEPQTLSTAIAKSCEKLQDRLAVGTLVFAFDGGYDYRKGIFPDYKIKRKKDREKKNEDPIVKESLEAFYAQLEALRLFHLPDVGAQNILYQKGYEADDVIAAAIMMMPNTRKIYVVSNDEDLYQCIEGNRVVVYRPTTDTIVNENDFKAKHHEVPPALYASIKAWTGCDSDNIPGLTGIGIVKASQFVAGKSKQPDVFYANIETFNRNIKLTKLPAPGTKGVKIVPQEKPLAWETLHRTLGSIKPKGIKA